MARTRSENLWGPRATMGALITSTQRGEDMRNAPKEEEFPTYLRKKAYTRCACAHHSHDHDHTTHRHTLHYPAKLG